MNENKTRRDFYDESYDDVDEVGMFDYDEHDELEDNEDDSYLFMEDNDEASSSDDIDETFPEIPGDDSKMLHLLPEMITSEPVGKEFEGEFDLAFVTDIFYDIGSEVSQIRAIEYAEFFAKKRIYEAQYFIIGVIQKSDLNKSHAVTDRALQAFYMFFRNYVRTTVEESYRHRSYTDINAMYSDIQDAMQYAWAYILNDIDKYDPAQASLTTYFKTRIKDAISNFEAKKRSRASKTTMRVDAVVSKAEMELIAEGLEPNIRLLAMKTGLSIEQVALSYDRILAENTMKQIDADENIANKKRQNCFMTPEDNVIRSEQTIELIEAFRCLTEMERKVYELCQGVQIILDDEMIVELDRKYNYNEISSRLQIDAIEVRQLEYAAGRKLKNYMIQKAAGKETVAPRKDKLLHNRSIIFSKSQDDEDLLTIIDEIDSISDSVSAK